jgi:cytochrome c oxidase assembly protein subunit 11
MKQILLTFICSLVLVSCFKSKSNESALKDQKAAFAEQNEKQVTVQFGGTVNPGVPMEFRPLARALKVTTGESNLVKYRFSNLSDKPIEIVAVHSVMPEGAAQFFKKIVCFCFEKQTLEPKQTVDMDVNFTVAKELPAEIDTIGLSYVVHEVKKDAAAL